MNSPSRPRQSSHKPVVLEDDQPGRLATLPVYILFSVFLLLYGLGAMYPDSFLWGVHHVAFTPRAARVLLFVVALGLALANRKYISALASFLVPTSTVDGRRYFRIAVAGIGAGVLFYTLRISIDMYGDSRTLLAILSGKEFKLGDVLSFSDNEPLARFLHQVLARLFGLDQRFTFQLVSAICGGALVSMYAWFVFTLDGSTVWKLFLLVIGLTGGVSQILFGHVEDYTVVYVWSVLFLILAWRAFDGKQSMVPLIVVFLIGTRLHIEMVLYLPALLFAVLYRRQKRSPAIQRFLEPKNILWAIGATLVVCVVAYIGYFKAYSYTTGDQPEKLKKIFLPLFNYLPSPHAYTLFSLNHVSDIVQEILLVVAPGAVILVALFVLWYRRIRWRQPRIIFYGLATFYFLLFDFTVDPFLSPARDWDLLSLVAAPWLFFVIAVSERWVKSPASEVFWKAATGCALGLAVLSSTIFYVNSREDTAGARLRSLGIWTFKSYYQGSAYIVNVAERINASGEKEILEREQTIRELGPYASERDFELGFLVHKVAALLFTKGEYDSAKHYYRMALDHDSTNASAWRYLALTSLFTRDFTEADHRITIYNENINIPDVIDFGGLQIAAYTHYCMHLVHTNKDSTFIQRALDDARTSFH